VSHRLQYIMSVITTTSQSPPVTFESMSHISSNCKQQYAIALEDIPPRSPSISSYSSNYSHHSASTASTVYSVASPTTPKSPSYRLFKQSSFPVSQPPNPLEPAVGRLPASVYACILDQLQTLHEGPASHQFGCVTCYQRDLHSLALTNRSWERAVRSKL
jgi:hypothetical protein